MSFLKNNSFRFFGALFLILCFIAPLKSPHNISAQEIGQSIDLSLTSTPTVPIGGQSVTIQASSFGVDLNEMNLSWVYQGKVLASGYGKTKVIVTAPANGSTGVVEVTVSGGGIDPVSASLILRPGSVDLLWEGVESSVPPFYKGRPLTTKDGLFRVVAIPAAGAPKQINYQWSLNGSSLQNVSGNNRSSVVLKNDPLVQDKTVSLSVSGGLFQGTNNVSIPSTPPLIIGYQKNDGFIDFSNGGLDTINIPSDTVELYFAPFFFSIPKGLSESLNFSISAGGETITPDSRPNEVSLSRPDSTTRASLTVGVTTKTYSLQNARRIFTLLFQ